MRIVLLSGNLRRIHVPAIAAVLMLNLPACDWMQVKDTPKVGETRTNVAKVKRINQACASNRTYDRLKDFAFNEAIKIRNTDPVNLDKLATYSVIRMENPLVASRDDTLDVTVCRGRFILHLPPGAERGFNGVTRLEADVEYTAQAAADGSGLIYQLTGADPIIYRLAAFDLQGNTYEPPEEPEQKLAAAEPAPSAKPAFSTPAAAAAIVATTPPAPPQVIPAALPAKPPAPQAPKSIPAVVPVQPKMVKVEPVPQPKRPVRIAQAAAAKPAKAKDEPTPKEKRAEPPLRTASRKTPEPKAGKAAAAARTESPRKRQSVAAVVPSRPAKRSERKAASTESRSGKSRSGLAAAHPAVSRAGKATATAQPTRPAKQPAQTATAAAPKSRQLADRREAIAALKPSPAPVRASLPTPPARPPLSVRIPELAALRKPGSAAIPARPAASPPVRTAAATPPPRVVAVAERTNKAVAAKPAAAAPAAPVRPDQPNRLASLERSMTRTYNSALVEADGQARYELRRTRDRFLAYLDGCRTESCRARAYQGRIAEIRDIITDR